MAIFFDNGIIMSNLQMGVRLGNIFESGEAFWGFTAGTGAYSNEQSVCIKEVKTGSPDVPILNPNHGQDCEVARPRAPPEELKCGGMLQKQPLASPVSLKLRFVVYILIHLVVCFTSSPIFIVKSHLKIVMIRQTSIH